MKSIPAARRAAIQSRRGWSGRRVFLAARVKSRSLSSRVIPRSRSQPGVISL